MTPLKFRTIPVEVEAIQFDGTRQCAHAILKWIGYGSADDLFQDDPLFEPTLRFEDMGREYLMVPTDWVCSIKNRFKAMSDREFKSEFIEAGPDGPVSSAP